MTATAMTALDRLMDLARDRGATVTWGHRGALYTVTLDGWCQCARCLEERGADPPYHETAVGETREQAARGMLDTAFGEAT